MLLRKGFKWVLGFQKTDFKVSAVVQFATEAAITILRIDDMIRVEKSEEDEQ